MAEIQAQVRDEERKKLEAATAAARDQLQSAHRAELEEQAASLKELALRREEESRERFTTERAELEARLHAAHQEGEALAQAASSEGIRLAAEFEGKLEEERSRLTREAKAAVEADLTEMVKERDRLNLEVAELQARHETALIAARAEGERLQQERVAQLNSALEARDAEAAAETRRLEAVIAKMEASQATLATQHKAEQEAAVAEVARKHQEDLAQVRTALEKARDEQLRVLNKQRIDEQSRWQARLTELQRQIEKKTADELGRWPEIDLYQALQEAFKDDRVIPIGKGEEGADVIIEVMHRGELCGKIIVDSKNRKSWQNLYVEKLRRDCDAAGADHAVLATNVFPSGAKDICVREGGVVVVRPHGVITIARIFRESIMRNHIQRLGTHQRELKAAQIYDYLNSSEFRTAFASALNALDQLEDLDVAEKKSHDRTWQQRGTLNRQLTRTLGDVQTRISEIVESSARAEPQIA